MTHNTSNLDRIARGIVGLALIGLYAVDLVGLLGLAGGIALIASAAVGWCAVYNVLGLRTCPAKSKT